MILRILTITALALFGITAPAQAKGKKGKKGGADSGRVLSRFDRDHNGTIDGTEAARVQAMFAALAALDTDKDGKLSDSEVAAAKISPTPAKKKKAK